ncbi:dihydrofolate reductase family protein [Agromyces atrinae]|uniref:dihydrofolate reductase family protein n=1 Tax=Agromyces atrinae TaxID=592376 RepID=UPI001F5A2C0A|nr:dihydrofolate reductase family protein [Agromyces atrinae]MCI2957546.1 dihydrofolate reductase family protein [Agromyces atrinae]
MGVIAADLFLTLDGVYQAPGGVDEDPSEGFTYGGWQAPFAGRESGDAIVANIVTIDALLLGRTTYDIFTAYWPAHGDSNPIAEHFNRIPKFVVSRELVDPTWAGTTVLRDAASAGRLRDDFDEVHLIGSGNLLNSLLEADVVDRLNLWLYPLTLGSGKRLFGPGTLPASFQLAQPPQGYDGGAVSLVYERAGAVETANIDEL